MVNILTVEVPLRVALLVHRSGHPLVELAALALRNLHTFQVSTVDGIVHGVPVSLSFSPLLCSLLLLLGEELLLALSLSSLQLLQVYTCVVSQNAGVLVGLNHACNVCLLYTSPSPRDS